MSKRYTVKKETLHHVKDTQDDSRSFEGSPFANEDEARAFIDMLLSQDGAQEQTTAALSKTKRT